MDCTSDEFLAGTALAVNEHGGSTACDFADEFEHLDHLAALSDHGRCTRAFTERAPEMTVFTDQLAMFDCTLRDQNYLVEIDRLCDVIECALLHSLDRSLHRPECCHEHDGCFRGHGAKGCQHFHS